MSYTEHKSGFRVNLEFLRGKTRSEALEYFRSVIGEPKEIDQWEGNVEYFSYDGEYQPGDEYAYGEYPTKDDGWFVDKIVCKGVPSQDPGFYMDLVTIQKTIAELKDKFKVEAKDIMVFSYSWHNGTDEPRLMRPRAK